MNQPLTVWLQLQKHRLQEQGVHKRIRFLIKKTLRPLLQRLVDALNQRPRMRVQTLRLLAALGLDTQLKNLLVPDHPRPALQLTPRAQEIVQDLKQAIAASEKA